ncbi:GPR endopeptidase [Aneurinibacillus sp. Ricciae_BoGa-3]|uniref:GPR endopeptidase n=1 Tax=Aneurinibacillus sp. Ricciae_BoGa-3 TaxID=3022697 RepID=UPI0023411CD1|nr:GPR endopeptidase [Aneurinibacillus sp. Ricciae_BoGa-3]WCK53501.1 GPR endopeptidase [Aneurinibacillus sp. Ricciae_BoGa-3]
MSKKLDLSKYAVRTDLALEARELAAEKAGPGEVKGVKFHTEEDHGMTVSRIEVLNEEGAQFIGKLPGRYLTIEVPGLRTQDTNLQDRVTRRFARELFVYIKEMGLPDDASALVVGLGNWNVTPDAVGPMVVENILVTRHLFQLMPDAVEEGYRPVSAVSPGVLGITGIETSEIVYGVVDKTKPDFVIAVDALASRALERVNTTIQISDTGISPGSGVGNKRKPLNKETLGIPVIAVGIPTVVDAATIVHDSITYLLGHLGRQVNEARNPKPSGRLLPKGFSLPGKVKKYTEKDMPSEQDRKMLLGIVGELDEDKKRQLIHEVLAPLGHNLIVTPKEVDDYVEDIANVVASGLNAALHAAIDMDNVSAYTH